MRDYHTRAILIAAREAAKHLPEGAVAHFYSNLSFFYDGLNEDRSIRKQNNYRRSNGKGKPLAYRIEREALDGVLEARNLTVSAGRPNSDRSERLLDETKDAAGQATRNIGHSFGDWDI
ncbi:hypothetical protein [Microvirga pudoricolor]|uniref:hypothetical protein n=1 Tax=Microvirga pudoricolor TaxID=2778729 RepID=UPI00195272CD|nr:hypothetical protein [Microvirga pudoricolor]